MQIEIKVSGLEEITEAIKSLAIGLSQNAVSIKAASTMQDVIGEQAELSEVKRPNDQEAQERQDTPDDRKSIMEELDKLGVVYTNKQKTYTLKGLLEEAKANQKKRENVIENTSDQNETAEQEDLFGENTKENQKEQETVKDYTIAEAREILMEYAKKNGNDKARGELKKLNASKLSDLDQGGLNKLCEVIG